MPNPFPSPTVYAEIRDGFFHAQCGGKSMRVPWRLGTENAPDAAATAAWVAGLGDLVARKPWRRKPVIWCALPVFGVALRRVQLPAEAGAERQRLLQLQVESAFPLPPAEMIWGEVPESSGDPVQPGIESVTVAALRRAALEPLFRALNAAGFHPVFTLACLVRDPDALGGFTGCRLDVGPQTVERSEWKDGRITRIRGFGSAAASPVNADIRGVVAEALRDVDPASAVSIGSVLNPDEFAGLKAERVTFRSHASDAVESTPAMLGIQRLLTAGSDRQLLRWGMDAVAVPQSGGRQLPRGTGRWLARVAVLAVALLAFPYVEAFIHRPILRKHLATLQKDRDRLVEIDRRLEFLQYIADQQPPYLDAVYVIADAAPRGVRFNTFNMNRRGEVNLSGMVQMPPQVGEFRTRLVESGFFSTVVVEEQTQVQPGGGPITLRLSAQWKDAAGRESLRLGPELPDPPSVFATNTPSTHPPASRP